MAGRITAQNQIRINDAIFTTSGKVREFLASQPPGKLTLGDYSDASNPYASEYSIDDLRGGIGVNILDPRTDLDRAWYATTQLRYKGRIVLPRLAVQTDEGPGGDVDVLYEFKNEVYATFGTSVRVYSNTSDSWGSSVRTLPNDATDAAKGILYPSGTATETLVIASGADVDYATASDTWARNTTDIKYVVFWHELLWGIDNAGQLYYTDDLSSDWSVDAKLQLPAGYISGLVVARGADQEFHIYASTKTGLFIHDSVNQRFVETDMSEQPYHSDGGVGTGKWRGNIYYPAGNAIYEFQPGASTTVQTVGPDRDHGLPQTRRGKIIKLLSSHNDLLAVLDATSQDGLSSVKTRVSRGIGNHHGVTLGGKKGYGLIMGWDRQGWEVKWQSDAVDKPIIAASVNNAYNENRLWWMSNQRVYYMVLPQDVVNPLEVPTTKYGTQGTLETPWTDMGASNQSKLALSLLLETINPTSSETVKVEYATNYTESYTTILTQTSTGESETTFPIGGSNPIGLAFRSIKFRVTLARGTVATNTPQMVKLTLVWRQRNKELYGVEADIRLGDESSTHARKQLSDLKAAMLNDQLVEVTYRNDDSEEQNYYMEVINYHAVTETGDNHEGAVRVTLVEPRQTKTR